MSFVLVKLLNGYVQSLIYKIPDHWDTKKLKGTLVRVPLQKRSELALIESIFSELPSSVTYKIRELIALEQLAGDILYKNFIETLSNYYAIEPLTLYQRIRSFLTKKESSLKKQELIVVKSSEIQLTNEQQAIVSALITNFDIPLYKPTLIHGVTGSGKTEIYKKLVAKAYEKNKSTLLLLPEVSLAVQFTHLLKEQLPNLPIFGFHSATSIKEKQQLWSHITAEKPVVILGVHLPIMLPIANLGLIIIDE